MRLSLRHLSGLIYGAVDDFVRGPNVTGPTKRSHSQKRMRFKREAPSPDRSFSQFSRQFLAGFAPGPNFSPSWKHLRKHSYFRKNSHCRRSLPPAEFGKCAIDASTRPAVLGSDQPIAGGLVGCAAHPVQLPVPRSCEPRACIHCSHPLLAGRSIAPLPCNGSFQM